MTSQQRTWWTLLMAAIAVFGITILASGGFQSNESIAWGNVQVQIREDETATVIYGDQAGALLSRSSEISDLARLPPIQNATSCLEIVMEPVMIFLACAIEDMGARGSSDPVSTEQDMALFKNASEDLAAHIGVGNAVVEESPQLVKQFLSESWTVYSAVRKFRLSDVECYGFTIQRLEAERIHLELVGRCVTPNGPGFIWGSYSDLSRLDNFFLNR